MRRTNLAKVSVFTLFNCILKVVLENSSGGVSIDFLETFNKGGIQAKHL